MARFAFEDFYFDARSYSLTRHDAPVPLRPKTAKLLALFLANRGKVLGKTEIIAAIWENDHVPEYALHQLVSEVRKLAKDKALIRTQPNQGYCWIAQTELVEDECQPARGKLIKPRTFWPHFAGATLAACLIAAFGALPLGNGGQQSSSLPGIRALAKGIIALEKGDQDAATAWFEFVLAENPQASEARLLLAESLLQQNRLQEASAYLLPLLASTEDKGLNPSDYDKMAAAELISRIRQRSGRHFEALEFARQSLFYSHAQCTLEYLDDRIRRLATLTGETWTDAPLRSQDELPELDSAQSPDYQKYCQLLKSSPSEDEASVQWPSPAPQAQRAIQAGVRRAVASDLLRSLAHSQAIEIT